MTNNVQTQDLASLQSQLTQAEAEEAKGNYDEAERLSKQVFAAVSSKILEEPADTKRTALQAEATCILGRVCVRRGDYAQALEYLQSSLQSSEQINDKAGIAKALGNIGSVYSNTSDYSQALKYHNKALSIAEELGNKSLVGASHGNIGLVHFNLSDYAKSLECYGTALGNAEELGNKSAVATWLGNIGNVHLYLSDYPKALEYLGKALGIAEELGNKARMAEHLSHIGLVLCDLGDYLKALEYHGNALSIAEEFGNKSQVAPILGNIGSVHFYLSDYPKALEYYGKALGIAEELGNKSGVATWLGNIGNVYSSFSDYPKALEYYNKALGIVEELGYKLEVATWLCNIGVVHLYLSDHSRALKYLGKALSIEEELGNKSGVASALGNIGDVHMKLSDYAKAQEYFERGLGLQEELGRRSSVGEIKRSLGELYAIELNPNRDESKAEAYLLDSITVSEELGSKKYDAHKTLADLYAKQKRWEESHYHIVKYFTLKEDVQSEEARKKAQLMEQQKQIAEREKEISIAKAAADAQMSATTTLLYKVLPQSVATRMIEGEAEIADYFPQVSILFADIAGFTPISADMPAIVVVRFLNYVFGEFDRIIKKHGCEKIKTIGDGYMAVCGAPVECADHAERLASAALEMQQTISLPESIAEFMPSGVEFGIRIGLHTGSVVAGVIGEERFVYDVYSDAVNTAARMESHGEENRIHCSNDFYRHLQNRFAMTKNTNHGFVFEKRGEMEIKGKGMMRTYFLERV